MKITAARYLPTPLKQEIKHTPQGKELLPGFLIGIDEILEQYPVLHSNLSTIQSEYELIGRSCLVVPPEQTFNIFAYDKELDLIKTIAGNVAMLIHPHLKTGIDGLWLWYKAAKLYDDWKKPNRDTAACLFKVAGLALSTIKAIGSIYPDLKIPDHWANGINFVVKSGESLYKDRTPPINEMILSSDKRLAIPLKLLKVAGIAIDPRPEFQSITVMPLPTAVKK